MPADNPRYSKRMREALAYAEEEAGELSHHYIGTEHLLLGLVRVEDGVGAKILRRSGVTVDLVREAVKSIIGLGESQPGGSPGYTPRAQRVLTLASEQADRLSHRYIGTEHLLLGLLTEGGGVGAQMLAGFGVTLENVDEEISRRAPEGVRGPQGIKGVASRIAERERGVRRYSLVLPELLFEQVQELADAEQSTVAELFRRFTKLGLLVMEIQRSPDASIVIRQDGSEQRLLVL
jgi:ATP-dependent Clp protease ATP-binding subunit ClpA